MFKTEKSFHYKIFIIFIPIFLLTKLSANSNQHILNKLNLPTPNIPLKEALGDKIYNNTIGTGKYSFVGDSKCRLCHRDLFINRKKDSHNYTMKNIVSTKYEDNSRCLTCHSTGYRIKSGFIDMAQTPRLANVQCESCHGPGNIHIEVVKKNIINKKISLNNGLLAGQSSPKVLKKICISCHPKRWNKSYHNLDEAYDNYKMSSSLK